MDFPVEREMSASAALTIGFCTLPLPSESAAIENTDLPPISKMYSCFTPADKSLVTGNFTRVCEPGFSGYNSDLSNGTFRFLFPKLNVLSCVVVEFVPMASEFMPLASAPFPSAVAFQHWLWLHYQPQSHLSQ